VVIAKVFLRSAPDDTTEALDPIYPAMLFYPIAETASRSVRVW